MQRNTFTFSQAVSTSSRAIRLSRYFKALGVLMLVLAAPSAFAQEFIGSQLAITANTTAGSSNTTYAGTTSAISTSQITFFNGSDLGKGSRFDLNTGSLNITLTSDTLDAGSNTYTSSTFYYRVYIDGSTAPAYSSSQLNRTSAAATGSPVIYANNSSIDLLSTPRTIGGGTYRIDIYYDAVYRRSRTNTSVTITDPGNGSTNPYSATFRVIAPDVTPAGSTTTWQSTSSTNWFMASNWTNGVPTGTSDAIIPENTQGTNIIFPVLNNRNVNYRVRNITLNGRTNSGRAQLTVQNAVLHIYGNIQQLSGGLVGTVTSRRYVADSTQNSTLMLRGANQFITGQLNMPDVIVSGTGIKSIANSLLINNVITFIPIDLTNGVLVQSASAQQNQDGSTSYVFDTTGNSLVDLGNFGKVDSLAGRETTVSYIKGILRAKRALRNTQIQRFGNIGLDLIPNHDATTVTVQRIIGDPLIGPTVQAPNVQPMPIKRQFYISGDNSNSGNNNAVIFHYLNSEYELNGIDESNLTLFRTITGSAPYTRFNGALDLTAKTVTVPSIVALDDYFLTLGDRTNPLPVSLATFAAARSGDKAIITWATATEENNKGFNVQVSADGVKYRNLAFVDSKNSNSVNTLNYSYIDNEANKAGTRYYRLEQVDFSGETSFSPVRAVSFSGAAATSLTLAASPNPFNDYTSLSFEGLSTTDGPVHVRLIDMTGRIIRDQDMTMSGASVSLNNLGELRSGLYLAKVTLADGTTKTVRVQRQ